MDYDLIIIGGGIGGSALAAVMASAGYKVLGLEQSAVYEDRVRGEWIAPWGVAEVKRLGLHEVLIAAGAHELTRHVTYDPAHDWQEVEATAMPINMILPEAGGPLTLGHPHHCQILFDHAAKMGATMLRDVQDASASLGSNPSVTYSHKGETQTASCRFVVGAEGRKSAVREAADIEVRPHKPHHMFAGMLVEGADDWPADLQAIGTEGNFGFLAFPQGQGRVRLYGSFDLAERQRFLGPDGPQKFLAAMNMKFSPRMKALAGAKPAGPVLAYFNHGADGGAPYAQGMALVGDAAAWSDPILGQGLSITYRDVRVVSDILRGSDDWSAPDLMAPYGEERAERMRRMHFACELETMFTAEFGPQNDARRASFHARRDADPTLAVVALTSLMGPESLPAELFTPAHREKILNG